MSRPDDRQTYGWEGDADTAVETDSRQQTEKPRLYKVLLHNDDYTTMEFVVEILMDVFHHAEAKAVEIMLNVHHRGIGIAGVYTYEVAETKVKKVFRLARDNGYPLRCTMEPA